MLPEPKLLTNGDERAVGLEDRSEPIGALGEHLEVRRPNAGHRLQGGDRSGQGTLVVWKDKDEIDVGLVEVGALRVVEAAIGGGPAEQCRGGLPE